MTDNGKQVFIAGHPEYDALSLAEEYLRDLSAGKNLASPKTTFPATIRAPARSRSGARTRTSCTPTGLTTTCTRRLRTTSTRLPSASPIWAMQFAQVGCAAELAKMRLAGLFVSCPFYTDRGQIFESDSQEFASRRRGKESWILRAARLRRTCRRRLPASLRLTPSTSTMPARRRRTATSRSRHCSSRPLTTRRSTRRSGSSTSDGRDVPGTLDNLNDAGSTARTTSGPTCTTDFAKAAEEEGFTEISPPSSAWSAPIEKHHEERYRALIDNIETGKVFSRDGDAIWICRNCGHIVIGKEPPEICPVCAHPKAYFELRSVNY